MSKIVKSPFSATEAQSVLAAHQESGKQWSLANSGYTDGKYLAVWTSGPLKATQWDADGSFVIEKSGFVELIRKLRADYEKKKLEGL